MITVSWLGSALTDDDCEKVYSILVSREQDGLDTEIGYASENIYNRIRLGIVEGDLRCEDVTFEFEGKFFRPNRFGAIAEWPDGWCDYNVSISEKILYAAMMKRKAERKEKSK